MNLGPGARLALGVVLILLGTASIFSAVDERIFGGWTGSIMGFPVVPFVLLCGGLWLIVRRNSGQGTS
jgi:hypothetical protein